MSNNENIRYIDPVAQALLDSPVDTAKLSRQVRVIEQNKLLEALLAAPSFKVFLGMLLEETGFLANSFRAASNGNASEVAYLEGRRSVGETIYKMLQMFATDQPVPHECLMAFSKWDKDVKETIQMYIAQRNSGVEPVEKDY